MPHPRRILLIRPSALGDVCRSVPVLVSLKRAFPEAEIDWLVQDSFAPAIAAHPDLSSVVPFARSALGRWRNPASWRQVGKFLRSLRERGYDLVLDCQGLARSGIFAAATGAARRIGFANAAEFGWLGLTEGVHAPRSMHTVDRMLLVAAAAGAPAVRDMRLYTTAADRDAAAERLGPEAAGGPYILLAPTTRWPGKQWPAERFAELAERLLAEGAPRVVFVGAASEHARCRPLVEMARREPRVIDLVGRTSIGELMAVVESAALVVACDSAALHMAAGFDRPLVALFGPTDASRVGPYGRSADVLQVVRPGDRLDHKDEASGCELMRRISVDEAAKAALARLGSAAKPMNDSEGAPAAPTATVHAPRMAVRPAAG